MALPLSSLNRNLPGLIPDLMRHWRLIPKVAGNYAALALGKRRLRTVDFAVTFDCQCACEHCYASPMTATRETLMTLAETRSAIEQCLALGAISINFVGGDPFCHPHLVDLVAGIPRHRAVTLLTTNGLGLTDQNVRRLAAARLAYVAVSIDYHDAERHDRFRGRKGVHAAAMEGLERARAAGIGIIVNTIVTPDNLDDGNVDRLVDHARRVGARITLCLPAVVGAWESKGEVVLSPEQRRHFDALMRQPHVRWDGSTNYLREGCAAGTEKINITAYGDVMPCAIIHLGFGNVKREPLADIWERMSRNSHFSGKASHCLAIEDRGFVEEVIREVNRHPQRPVPADVVLGKKDRR